MAKLDKRSVVITVISIIAVLLTTTILFLLPSCDINDWVDDLDLSQIPGNTEPKYPDIDISEMKKIGETDGYLWMINEQDEKKAEELGIYGLSVKGSIEDLNIKITSYSDKTDRSPKSLMSTSFNEVGTTKALRKDGLISATLKSDSIEIFKRDSPSESFRIIRSQKLKK